MLLIFAGSTDAFSAEHTSRFLVPFLRWLDPHISFATIVATNFALRKIGHFAEYAILSALLWRALGGTVASRRTVTVAAIALAISAILAASDEFHQSLVATRTASGNDVVIDLCGAIVAIGICLLIKSGKQERKK